MKRKKRASRVNIMSDPAVIDWDRIIHKNVRSKDMEGAGNVVAIDGDSVIISTQGGQHQYKIPKSHVEGYNGAEVYLDLSVGELSSLNTDDNNKSQAINKEILANESKQETTKIPIPPLTTKTITTTATVSSKTQNYNNNKPEKSQQGAITNTVGLHKHTVDNSTIQKEQDLIKKKESISSITEVGPVKSEVKAMQSITSTANETSTLSAMPTTETQGKNNSSVKPQPSLTTKTLEEALEKKTSDESTEVTEDIAVQKIDASQMIGNSKIQQQNQRKIDNELTASTIQRPEIEVIVKPPNNIEFNPPISAENISTLIETGLSGRNAVDDISKSKEQEERERPQSLHEEKIGQNKDLLNSPTPFTTGFALWQLFIIYWIDMYNEFVTDAAKLTEYWFNAFVNPSTKREEKNDEK
ncbi:MAG TPA: hypothetical protein VE619_06680 [Nitrososphaeraceae archaeon]|nr:hypothetical protein [Nitrososphaeraceae archaeon]